MNILLTIDDDHEPRLVAAYVAERFGDALLGIDLLQVVPPAAAASASGPADHDIVVERARRQAGDRLAGFAAALRTVEGVARVDTHVVAGDTADAIAESARRLGSALIVYETRGDGRLARWREAHFTAELLRLAPCAVELVKPIAAAPRSLFNVLLPISGDRLESYPWATIAALPWPRGTHLQFLGMLPGSAHDMPLETNAFRLIETLSSSRAAASRAGASLFDACARLGATLGAGVTIDYALADATDGSIVATQAQRYRASLVVTCSHAEQRGRRARARFVPLFARDAALQVAAQAACPVLVLRDDDLGIDAFGGDERRVATQLHRAR